MIVNTDNNIIVERNEFKSNVSINILQALGLNQHFFSFLPTTNIVSLSLTNRKWSFLIKQDNLWKQVAKRYTEYDSESYIHPKQQIISLHKRASFTYEPSVISIFGSLENILSLPVIHLDESKWGADYAMNQKPELVYEFENLNAPSVCRGTVDNRNWIAIQFEKHYVKPITQEVIAKYNRCKKVVDFDPADYPDTSYGVYILWHRFEGWGRIVLKNVETNYFYEDLDLDLTFNQKELKDLVKGELCIWDDKCTRKLRTNFPVKQPNIQVDKHDDE